jgi:3,4-dihydroxy 2-butanone 4-phosphate synthase/GTP cyclohydrolase II
MPFSPLPDILEDLRRGKMVVLADDEKRENEGDLVLPAQFVTPEGVTFMLSKALGYLCLCLTEADCDRLGLHPQASVNTTTRGTAFTVSIDLHPKFGGTTGVSARERAKCIQLALDPRLGPDDFVRPGHINPLRSLDGGVLVRTGQTEGSVDLCRLAGLSPAAVIIEVMKPDGEMARVPDLAVFCREHGLKMCSVQQIIEYRLERESLVRRIGAESGTTLYTEHGAFQLHMFESMVDPLPHVALTVGDVGGRFGGEEPTLVRMHRRTLLGDVFHEVAGEGESSGRTLKRAMKAVQAAGRGAIVYLRTNGAGVSGMSELEGRLQEFRRVVDVDKPDFSRSGAPMDAHHFGIGGQILRALGLKKLRLMTNHPRALPGLTGFGIEIVEHVPLGDACTS